MFAERAFLVLFCLLPVCAAPAQSSPASSAPTAGATPIHSRFPNEPTDRLAHQIAGLIADPGVSRAHWGIAVTELDGKPLYGLNEAQWFRPASNAKLFTTAVAMALLGPETRVTTVVSADAPPDANGVVRGDIVLHGAGDANLSGRHIPYESPAAQKARLSREQDAGMTNAPSASQNSQGSTEAAVPNELVPMEDLAAQIAAAGVKTLTGAVRGDADLWRSPGYAESWDAGDAVWGYGAEVSALEFNDDQLEMRLMPGAAVGQPAQIQLTPNFFGVPHGKLLTVATEREAGIEIAARPFPASNIVQGTVALGHPDTEEVAVPDPALFAATALQQRLSAHGIKGGTGTQTHLPPPASAAGTLKQEREPVELTFRPESVTSPICGRDFTCGFVLAKRTSPTLADDVTVTLKVSQNLHAEMLLRRLGRAYGTEGSFAQGARVVRQWLLNAGLDGDDFVFYDGSGLSSHDLVTPRATAQLLAYATKQPWFAQWKAALPVGGEDGSLASRFPDPPLKDHVFAKTGTLGESRALSGYLDCASGKQVIFSVMVDNHTPASAADRSVMDKIVAAIAAAE